MRKSDESVGKGKGGVGWWKEKPVTKSNDGVSRPITDENGPRDMLYSLGEEVRYMIVPYEKFRTLIHVIRNWY